MRPDSTKLAGVSPSLVWRARWSALARGDQHKRLWVLAIALGLALDLSGALHVYGLGMFMGQRLSLGVALLLVAIALGWLMAARVSVAADRQHAARTLDGVRPVRRSVIVLMLLAWLATARDLAVFLAPGLTPLLAVVLGGGALALIVAAIRPPAPGWLVLGAALFGSIIRLASFAYVPIAPERGDMLPLVQGALGNLLSGRSPYTIYRMPWELPLTYLPVTWLAYLPPYLLGLDIRLTNLFAELLIGAVLVALAMRRQPGIRWGAAIAAVWRGETDLLLWAWVFLQPTALHWSLTTTAPVFWALLAVTLALLARGRERAAAFALGVCAAASPLVAVVAPFALLRWLRAAGIRRALLLVACAGLVAAAFILPFLLWSPEQFIFGGLRWFNDNELFPRQRWEQDHIWANIAGFSGVFWRHGLVGVLKPLQALLLAGLAALYLRWGATAGRLAPLVAAAFLLFTVFNPVLWPYLYTPALIAALVAVIQGGTHTNSIPAASAWPVAP